MPWVIIRRGVRDAFSRGCINRVKVSRARRLKICGNLGLVFEDELSLRRFQLHTLGRGCERIRRRGCAGVHGADKRAQNEYRTACGRKSGAQHPHIRCHIDLRNLQSFLSRGRSCFGRLLSLTNDRHNMGCQIAGQTRPGKSGTRCRSSLPPESTICHN